VMMVDGDSLSHWFKIYHKDDGKSIPDSFSMEK
jgi:hypothetical protein